MGLLFSPLRMYSQAAPRNSCGVACEYIQRGMKSRPIGVRQEQGAGEDVSPERIP